MTLDELKAGRTAVLMGGTSAEREVSLQSGTTVQRGLDEAGFQTLTIDPADANWLDQLRTADFAFIALHGPGGEDGTLQGALELLDIPYSGTGVLGSALALDKLRCKQLWQGAGLPTAGFEVLRKDSDWQAVIDRLGTVFVKPACEGSSIGMAKAGNAGELQHAWQVASEFAGPVLAEQFVDGPEYTVGVLGVSALPAILLETDNEFYDYEAKYLSDDTRYLCPCGLSDSEEKELAALSLNAFFALDCAVWGRVDVMRDSAGRFQLLEVNTVPGMTTHSLVPMAAAQQGMDVAQLVERVVALSLERGE
ncbi:MAG: D-alanine--D-alanine ligase [Halioglobus sp.]